MKKTLIALALLVACLSLVVACNKKDDNVITEYVTNANGEVVTDKDGEKVTKKVSVDKTSYEYVTNEKGEKVTDENGKAITTKVYWVEVTDENGKIVTSKVSGENIGKKPGATNPSKNNGTTTTTKPTTTETTAPINVTLPSGTNANNTERIFETKYKSILRSGKYVIGMTLISEDNGQKMELPVTFAVSGNSMFMDVKMDKSLTGLASMNLQFLYDTKNSYIILPSIRMYSVSNDITGDDAPFDPDEIQSGLDNKNTKYVRTTTINTNGIKYICEEYSGDGMTYKYYFSTNTKELKRIEFINQNGETMISNISQFSSSPAASYFKVPSGYIKINLNELGKLLGNG